MTVDECEALGLSVPETPERENNFSVKLFLGIAVLIIPLTSQVIRMQNGTKLPLIPFLGHPIMMLPSPL